jgi:single-strand DNA-binding protein
MADINHVVLVGRLTRDAELKYTTTGFPISTFSLAINRRRKNGDQWVDEAHYFDVELFGKTAESLKPYLTKGKQIAVDGELRQDRWEKDGQKNSKVMIAATNVQLLGGGSGGSGGSSGSYSKAASSSSSYTGSSGGYTSAAASDAPQTSSPGDDFPEDIPF